MRAPGQSAREAAADAPPAIHVTIGRVEVRAVVPQSLPQTPQPARKSNPVIPLDDYLKQQSSPAARA